MFKYANEIFSVHSFAYNRTLNHFILLTCVTGNLCYLYSYLCLSAIFLSLHKSEDKMWTVVLCGYIIQACNDNLEEYRHEWNGKIGVCKISIVVDGGTYVFLCFSTSFFCLLFLPPTTSSSLLYPQDNGPCLGSRKPKQPYEWMSYKEVRVTSSWPPAWESYRLQTTQTFLDI